MSVKGEHRATCVWERNAKYTKTYKTYCHRWSSTVFTAWGSRVNSQGRSRSCTWGHVRLAGYLLANSVRSERDGESWELTWATSCKSKLTLRSVRLNIALSCKMLGWEHLTYNALFNLKMFLFSYHQHTQFDLATSIRFTSWWFETKFFRNNPIKRLKILFFPALVIMIIFLPQKKVRVLNENRRKLGRNKAQ